MYTRNIVHCCETDQDESMSLSHNLLSLRSHVKEAMDIEASDFNVTDEEEFVRYASVGSDQDVATSSPPTALGSAVSAPAVSASSVSATTGPNGKRNRSSGLCVDVEKAGEHNCSPAIETPSKRPRTAAALESTVDLASLIRNQTKLIMSTNSDTMKKLDDIKATAEDARASADAAKAAVEEARAIALEAKSSADGAMDVAEDAKVMAEAAIAAVNVVDNRMNARIAVLEDRVERMKRNADLLVNGVPLGGKETYQELLAIVGKMTSIVGVGGGKDDIEAVRVLPRTKTLLVKFGSANLRRKFFHAYMGMGGLAATDVGYVGDERIFVSDNLTPHNSHLRFLGSNLVKANQLASCVVRDGIVYVTVTANGNRTPVFTKEDLDRLVSVEGAGRVPAEAGRNARAAGRFANPAPVGRKSKVQPTAGAGANRGRGRGRGQGHAQSRN